MPDDLPDDNQPHTPPSQNDWRTIWRQMAAAMTHTDDGFARLQHRARAYASPIGDGDDLGDDESYHVLCFSLGQGSHQEKYAIDVMTVRNVRYTGDITRVPGLPDFYAGIINVRGQMITVLDLRRWYGNPAPDMPAEVIITEAGSLQLALLAGRIEQVMRIPYQQVTPLDLRDARGVTPDKRIVLDIAALFADERLIIGGMEDAG